MITPIKKSARFFLHWQKDIWLTEEQSASVTLKDSPVLKHTSLILNSSVRHELYENNNI